MRVGYTSLSRWVCKGVVGLGTEGCSGLALGGTVVGGGPQSCSGRALDDADLQLASAIGSRVVSGGGWVAGRGGSFGRAFSAFSELVDASSETRGGGGDGCFTPRGN